MPAILAFLGKVPTWLYAILFALCVIGVQQLRVHHYKAQATTLTAAVTTFESAQKTNLSTIRTLQDANADWARKCAAPEPEARQQAQLSVKGDTKRQASAHETIQALQATYEHEPTLKAWADVPVPAVAYDSLRKNGSTD